MHIVFIAPRVGMNINSEQFNFFEYINEGSTISMAVDQAVYRVINDNWWWWTFFGQSHDDFASPILYENGDALRLTCGNGNYENSKSLNNERSKFDFSQT